MACPCFFPVERLPHAAGKQTSPVPLGDPWSGMCHSAGAGDWSPDTQTLRQCCNFGYAREKCARFPAEGPDAVRFGISNDRDGLVRIYWVMEKDHQPFAHGPLDYSRAEAGFRSTHPDACLTRQAQAYVISYLRRKEDSVRP